ncbi:MAG: hypothetical protein ACPGSO_00775 [Vicingaceae bacterium]
MKELRLKIVRSIDELRRSIESLDEIIIDKRSSIEVQKHAGIVKSNCIKLIVSLRSTYYDIMYNNKDESREISEFTTEYLKEYLKDLEKEEEYEKCVEVRDVLIKREE